MGSDRSSGSPARGGAGRRGRGQAAEALLEAARAEFEEHGFEGTDSNRIARRAGFAPQTFYRHYSDKTAIFVAVYLGWIAREMAALDRALRRSPGAGTAARTILTHHRRFRRFRRSLRALAVADPTVREARARSRLEQAERMASGLGRGRTRAECLALLLVIERIADAAAEDELRDLGLSRADEEAMLMGVLARLGVAA